MFLPWISVLQTVLAMSVSPDPYLHRRTVHSEAKCIDGLGWLNNSLSQDPCLISAYLASTCTSGSWRVERLHKSTNHYSVKNLTETNACVCSWAVYNTLQACAGCQEGDFSSAVIPWLEYNVGCTGTFLSNTEYYPTLMPIPNETTIPFWETTNPPNWTNGTFNEAEAKNIININGTNITPSQSAQSSSSTSITPSQTSGLNNHITAGVSARTITGAVVGGVLFLIVIVVLALYLARRRHALKWGYKSGRYSALLGGESPEVKIVPFIVPSKSHQSPGAEWSIQDSPPHTVGDSLSAQATSQIANEEVSRHIEKCDEAEDGWTTLSGTTLGGQDLQIDRPVHEKGRHGQ